MGLRKTYFMYGYCIVYAISLVRVSIDIHCPKEKVHLLDLAHLLGFTLFSIEDIDFLQILTSNLLIEYENIFSPSVIVDRQNTYFGKCGPQYIQWTILTYMQLYQIVWEVPLSEMGK